MTTLLFLLTSESCGQDQTIGGGPGLRPLIPIMEQRPEPSPLEQRNLIRRNDGDNGSIANLIKNVNDSDALLEVVVGRSRLLTLQAPLADSNEKGIPVVAVGDPSVLEFDILPSAQAIRILGRRVGNTDLSVVTANGKVYSFEIQVVYDLNYLRAYVKQLFPNATIQVMQIYEHLVVEGEASSTTQATQVIEAIQAYLASVQVTRSVKASSTSGRSQPGIPQEPFSPADDQDPYSDQPLIAGIDEKPDVTASLQTPQIINLIRVPGVQQVMLKVKIAEVNRTALRQMGTDWFYRDSSGRTIGFNPGSASPLSGDGGDFLGLQLGGSATSFAIFPNTTLVAAFEALRNNQVLNILAEPNLMAMHGQKASFLAGGEFPVPVPQNFGGGANTTFTVQFKEFGVLLDFIPYIMEDGAIRLNVAPEVSTIDPTIGVTSAGITIPGVNTRRANTTVELRQGQTLALAGLIQVTMDGNTRRIPGLGDVPYIGSLFSNNTSSRTEKELVILVSPYLAGAMEADEVPPLPGCELKDPDDYEFFALNRIEGRHPDVNYRATNGWDDPLEVRNTKTGQPSTRRRLHGPYGFSK